MRQIALPGGTLSLATVLAGKKNVGKFIHTQSSRIDLDMGKSDLDKWEFIPLDMKMDKFIASQIEISKRADVAIASGIGLAHIVIKYCGRWQAGIRK